ncbi:MAG: 8-amino-7-oxononanoate synthase [Candidatus Dactylopiibacterium carminicum]|uniref:8-amino-7-oxononanoate synthase n=1 Tax=Candidatus Dactylopiibacterium carminicum TaxID=857335 RepID=A0A272ESR6_9RHOO|nr:aminotransferase class I/II-fold pyridoxal phosphate-dependent enzyme [Candidatus Dactylopiibacterium carminicum]KAF7599111.1 8-amino-7-oxononanoate synthase [Candidatus Dactylopiibacterium carminicum]PAS93128.1 MAG: 8-amino-7-oxononanoate synthase [Candidatus Dactylopiibacterium carminicum]PAS99124.1 MAG: 8-amino-7-oxononanoate synthase [Candidatus Dactylopiibacterium carminicum]
MNKRISGLGAQLKEKLIQQSLERRLRSAGQTTQPPQAPRAGAKAQQVPEQFRRFDQHPGYQQLRIISEGGTRLGIANPFFKLHEGRAGAHTTIAGKDLLNFANYNYLGFSGDPRVNAAAVAAIERYGTSVSASRVVSGERPIHRELERSLAALYGTDDAVVMVSGHAANVTTIGHLFGPRDLIVHDELVHNSILQGIKLSGAKRLPFAHNDWAALDSLLERQRNDFERVLIVVKGIYSMDGDYPDLPRFVEIRNRHQCFLMVDEAHSLGVMGKRGYGIREHFGLQGSDVDIWMGTLSKTLAGCGGYIAGEHALIEHLKFLAPGFLYSVGMAPPLAAASLAALECLHAEPARVEKLQHNGQLLLESLQRKGIDTGHSTGLAVVPAIVGSSVKATRLSASLLEQGINVQPILYPAVPEKAARLRFFVSCEHSPAELQHAARCTAETLADL